MINKIIFFLLKKKVETATGQIDQVSRTKLFLGIEALLQCVEWASYRFYSPVVFPTQLHLILCSLAGIAYRDAKSPPEVIAEHEPVKK